MFDKNGHPVQFVVAVAASAGGLKALTDFLSAVPAGFPGAIVVVQHLSPEHESRMPEILSRRTPHQVAEIIGGEVLERGHVYIAPPDQHVLINPDHTMSLSHSELVHFVRPSADLLFESAAGAFRERAIAVVLTGTGSDGSFGVAAVKKAGGTVIVQDEATSEFFGMPSAAIATGCVDLILPLDDIAPELERLVGSLS
jgi:two-component system, chemotaxis family, protein-glutamate methylesterase/glutaminase